MNAKPFVVGTQSLLIKDLVAAYTVSGQRLEAAETVQAVARLPYCLYIPSTRYVFKFPGDGELVGVVPQKVWTERSQGSITTETELVVPDEPVYLAATDIVTDWMGQPEAVSGELHVRNIEFDRDPNGYFRYTRLTVEFDWRVPGGFDPIEERNVGATEEGER